ncbi:division/cell wall cluster transcriptional repressor MraZ [Caloranaerobacter azorensis]|uniref:Transcriptional regulator MraZ n=3 Tax=Caloranaerobacter azorensis TaxID=116090 RepID=A0A1M5U329_9FIRM|nr:division/cell wall cluster transcriptional repressor MraZ [Caloranaerobacter azorensis]KGG80560.1 cell division protein MraZ [Caloranaerobacter azorensis H53214]QIB26700.1 division/cell wall cluster transcriptional repressor MraZ [Caloranaerobacter azorensis]SHH57271.1 MraZ protein [Caloranaerobacter azorensis DSM 13643]
MFIGEYQHSIDKKGRLIIPAKFREDLGESFILTKGLDNCLFVYPKDEWKVLEEKLKSLPLTRKDARAFVRFFFAGATECELDKQGRILIPSNLRQHCKLVKDAIIIGVSNRVEIWSKEEWILYNEDENLSYENIAEKMAELGI